ncbi:MAG: orotidine 5'-phosphate decarboxylase [Candidatus Altiarchaeota archaeon]|nr:orotidine 5'-phosphate decarboxylase [Candidatus Altiarchaeota archaeon]
MAVKVQLALDFLDLDRALKVAGQARKYVDLIEAGTPLIKSEGLNAVREIRKNFPGKVIVADMKVMDAGRVEVEAAAKAGADIVDVLGHASEATIKECVEAARNFNCKICVDLISCDNPVEKALWVQNLGADIVAVHTSIDDQMKAKTPFKNVREVSSKVSIPVAAAGGLNSESVVDAVKAGAGIVIVGGAITKAKNPGVAAKDIKDAVQKMKPVKTTLFKRTGDVKKILGKVSASNVSDAMHRGGALDGIKPVGTGYRAYGLAVTVSSCPGDWAKPVEAIDEAKKGDVLVITTGGVGPAVWGELATQSAIKKRISAVVVDGAVRDSDEIRALGFPVYSRIICPNAGEPKGRGKINIPIKVGDILIRPGDWVLCDGDGVVVVPQEKAVEIVNRAQDVLEKENRIREEIKEGSSLGKVTHLLKWEKDK